MALLSPVLSTNARWGLAPALQMRKERPSLSTMALLSLGTAKGPRVLRPVQTVSASRHTCRRMCDCGATTAIRSCYRDRDGCAWGRTASSPMSLFKGCPLPWRFCRSDTHGLDLSHATRGAFDAVATLTGLPRIAGECLTWSDWRSQSRKSAGCACGGTVEFGGVVRSLA